MQSISLDLMTESEYKFYQVEKAISLAMSNPVGFVKGHLESTLPQMGKLQDINYTSVLEGVFSLSEEAALYYVNNYPTPKGRTNLFLACAVWRSCADILFPTLRRYMDDELRNKIISLHSDYAVFATEAFKHKLDQSELKDLLFSLACNPNSIQIAVDYIRKHGGNNPWEYNLIIAQCAYTSEEWAWQLVKEFPKNVVFSSAARWHNLAIKMEHSNKVENQVKEACIRNHGDIAQKHINTKNEKLLHMIFTYHPNLRQRILRRKDINQLSYFKLRLKEFYSFQNKLQNSLKAVKPDIQVAC